MEDARWGTGRSGAEAQIVDPNRGAQSWTQSMHTNPGHKSRTKRWTQMVDLNGGPKWWTQMWTQLWTQIVDPNFYEGNLLIFSILDPYFLRIFVALNTLSGTLFATIWGAIWGTFGSMPKKFGSMDPM